MMHKFRCINCVGEYFDSSPEGGTYHHVCPPLPENATPKQRKAYYPRNENVAPSKGMRPAVIVSEGLGVECLSSKQFKEPAWITGVKKIAARAEEEQG